MASAIEPFEPVRSRSVASVVQRQIVDRIRSGRLKEGDVLPGERVLAQQMDVSRPTIRQAVERLVAIGVLVPGKGRGGGLRVGTIWVPGSVESAIEEEPDADKIFSLLEARRTLEPRLAQLAALRATAEDYEAMRNSIDLLGANKDHVSRAAQAETLFHRTIWHAAGNPALEKMMIDLHDQLGVVHDMMLRTPVDYDMGVELHERTLEMLMRGEPDEIEAEYLRHIGHFESIVEDVLGRKSVRTLPSFIAPRAVRADRGPSLPAR